MRKPRKFFVRLTEQVLLKERASDFAVIKQAEEAWREFLSNTGNQYLIDNGFGFTKTYRTTLTITAGKVLHVDVLLQASPSYGSTWASYRTGRDGEGVITLKLGDALYHHILGGRETTRDDKIQSILYLVPAITGMEDEFIRTLNGDIPGKNGIMDEAYDDLEIRYQLLMILKESFVHEYNHYLDSTKWDMETTYRDPDAWGGAISSPEDFDQSIYMNSPTEVNSWYRQWLTGMFDKAKRIYTAGLGESDFLDTFGTAQDFVDSFKSRMDYPWGKLDSEVQRRLLKRLVDDYGTLKDIALRGATP